LEVRARHQNGRARRLVTETRLWRHCYAATFAAYVSVVAPGAVAAQSQAGSAVVRGVVVDSLSEKPLTRAVVSIGQIEQITNERGYFIIASLTPGPQPVRVRHLGYREYSSTIRVGAGDTVFERVALQAAPTPMAVVTIAGKARQVPFALEAPYQRAARGVGHFFTKEDIERLQPYNVASLLNLIPGVSANDRGVTFQRCQSGLPSPALTLGGTTKSGGTMPGSASGKVQLWIDGYRLTGRNASDSLVTLLANVPISQIDIVEIYSGVAQIPAEFLEDACAVIAIWLKRW